MHNSTKGVPLVMDPAPCRLSISDTLQSGRIDSNRKLGQELPMPEEQSRNCNHIVWDNASALSLTESGT